MDFITLNHINKFKLDIIQESIVNSLKFRAKKVTLKKLLHIMNSQAIYWHLILIKRPFLNLESSIKHFHCNTKIKTEPSLKTPP